MTTDISGLYNAILNITDQFIGREVVRVNDPQVDPVRGKVVAVSIKNGGRLWVVWPAGTGEPTGHYARELMAVKEEDPILKNLKWAGKTVGSLRNFLEQVRLEGGGDKTVLNPKNEQHVAISIELPLAQNDRVAWSDPTEVDRSISGDGSEAKHNHDFTEVCAPPCPRSVSYRPVKDQPQA